MATLTITPIKTFISGETVTPAKLNELSQSTVALTAGTIVNADISASAAIALSKLATGALPAAITVASANLVDGTIVDADISATAAIDGSKVSPSFGSQNISTTGSITANGVASAALVAKTTGANSTPAVLLQNDVRDWRLQVAGGQADELYFYDDTANALRMAINANGVIMMGTATVGGAGGLSVRPSSSNGAAQLLFNRSNTAAASLVAIFENNGTTVGAISHTNTATTFATSSDYRLKESATPIKSGVALIEKLRPVSFTWKADGSAGRGFIAHELQAVAPEAVTGDKDAVDAEGNPQYQGVDASKLVPLLVAAVQELSAKVAALEAAR